MEEGSKVHSLQVCLHFRELEYRGSAIMLIQGGRNDGVLIV